MEWGSLDYDCHQDCNKVKEPDDEKTKLKKAVQTAARPGLKRKLSPGHFDEAKWEKRKTWLQTDFTLGGCLPKEKLALLTPEAETLAGTPVITATSAGLLCIACKRANVKSPWGRGEAADSKQGLKHHFIKRHVESKVRIQAVEVMLECSDALGPSKEEFSESLNKLNCFVLFLFCRLVSQLESQLTSQLSQYVNVVF